MSFMPEFEKIQSFNLLRTKKFYKKRNHRKDTHFSTCRRRFKRKNIKRPPGENSVASIAIRENKEEI